VLLKEVAEVMEGINTIFGFCVIMLALPQQLA